MHSVSAPRVQKEILLDREYNTYTAGLEPEYVLYGLEYVPEQCLSKSKNG